MKLQTNDDGPKYIVVMQRLNALCSKTRTTDENLELNSLWAEKRQIDRKRSARWFGDLINAIERGEIDVDATQNLYRTK